MVGSDLGVKKCRRGYKISTMSQAELFPYSWLGQIWELKNAEEVTR
jgi:hypothetical protein